MTENTGATRADVATRFQPGNRLAAGARGKAKPRRITTRIIQELERDPDDSGMTMEQRIARKVVEMAADGDAEMVRFIADRVEGRVMQAVEIMGRGGGPIITAEMSAVDAGRSYAQLIAADGDVSFDYEASEEKDDAEMMTIEGEATPINLEKEEAA